MESKKAKIIETYTRMVFIRGRVERGVAKGEMLVKKEKLLENRRKES